MHSEQVEKVHDLLEKHLSVVEKRDESCRSLHSGVCDIDQKLVFLIMYQVLSDLSFSLSRYANITSIDHHFHFFIPLVNSYR